MLVIDVMVSLYADYRCDDELVRLLITDVIVRLYDC